MRTLTHRQTERMVHDLFVDGRPPSRAAELFGHLAACTSCAQTYARYAALEGRLCADDEAAARLVIERAGRVLMARRAASRPRQAPTWVWRSAMGLALVTAAAAAVILAPGALRSDRVRLASATNAVLVAGSEELTARGGKDQGASEVGIRVFRLANDGAAVQEKRTLSTADTLAFSYTSMPRELQHLTLFGLQANGAVRWYYPTYGAAESTRVQTGVVDEPLPDGIALSVNHTPGALRIVAIFSPTSLAPRAVERALVGSGADAAEVIAARLGLAADVVMHTLQVELSDGSPRGD
jgi:hypothetical protein